MKIIINGVEMDATPEQEACMVALSENQDEGTYKTVLQQTIDTKAQEKQYSDGVSCASYATSTNEQWAAEAQAFVAWRDSVFAYGYDYLQKVQDGIITSPTMESFLAGIPTFVWP